MFILMFLFPLFGITAPLKNITCFNSLTSKLGKVDIKSPWQRTISNNHFTVLQNQTKQGLKTWVVTKSDSSLLVIQKQDQLIQHLFVQADQCREKIKIEKLSPKELFTSLDFYQFAHTHPNFVIILWSPHMAISQKELEETFQKSFPLPIVVVMDENADPTLAQNYIKKQKFPDNYLKKWGFGGLLPRSIEHYPTTLFVKDGSIVNLVPGFNGPVTLSKLIGKYL